MNKIIQENLEETINACIELRTALTKLSSFQKVTILPKSKEEKAILFVLKYLEADMESALKRKEYKGSGENINSYNSMAVHRSRKRRTQRVKSMIERYFSIVRYTPDEVGMMATEEGEKL